MLELDVKFKLTRLEVSCLNFGHHYKIHTKISSIITLDELSEKGDSFWEKFTRRMEKTWD